MLSCAPTQTGRGVSSNKGGGGRGWFPTCLVGKELHATVGCGGSWVVLQESKWLGCDGRM